jgi:hypothetical protein
LATPSENFGGEVRGASKIKLKKVNKMRTVTVRRVIADPYQEFKQGFLGVSSGLPFG